MIGNRSILAVLGFLFLAPGAACRGAGEGDWVVTRPADVARGELEFRFVAEDPAKASLQVAGPDGETLGVEKEVVISSSDVHEVHVNLAGDSEHYAVTLYFTPQGAQRLRDATDRNLGRQMAVMVNGLVLVAPRLQSRLGPSAMIAASYTKEEAEKLAQQLAP